MKKNSAGQKDVYLRTGYSLGCNLALTQPPTLGMMYKFRLNDLVFARGHLGDKTGIPTQIYGSYNWRIFYPAENFLHLGKRSIPQTVKYYLMADLKAWLCPQ